jgi:hypothetical protein
MYNQTCVFSGQADDGRRRMISVRLEGGLGDHVLGMRVLSFTRDRFPNHEVIAWSDAAGQQGQLQIAAMSPFISRVIPIRSTPPNHEAVGRLENVHPKDLAIMLAADLFVDAWGGDMFTSAAIALQVPVFEILRSRPQLVAPPTAEREAEALTGRFPSAVFVGLNLTKYGADFLEHHRGQLMRLFERVLKLPDVIILNFFTSGHEYAHWPEPARTSRRELSRREAAVVASFVRCSERIVPVIDRPLGIVVSLLKRCRYFIGVDNGIKHIAWALDIPHTFFVAERPKLLGTLRWMPDVHRMLTLNDLDAFDEHFAVARDGLGEDL